MDSLSSANDALIQAVKEAGGSKVVGPLIWPEMLIDAAKRKLLDCLNTERPHHLTPEQAFFIFRLARDKGSDAGMTYASQHLGYAMPARVDPPSEAVETLRRIERVRDELVELLARLPKAHA